MQERNLNRLMTLLSKKKTVKKVVTSVRPGKKTVTQMLLKRS